MGERPQIQSSDDDIVASGVEFRAGRLPGRDGGDWYVTWMTRSRPWEITVMRLSSSEHAGQVWHHGRSVAYRVHWAWIDQHRDSRARSGGGAGRATGGTAAA